MKVTAVSAIKKTWDADEGRRQEDLPDKKKQEGQYQPPKDLEIAAEYISSTGKKTTIDTNENIVQEEVGGELLRS